MKNGVSRFLGRMSERTELPLAEICREFTVGLNGRREAIFDGVVSVKKYEKELIVLQVCSDTVSVFGSCLEMKNYYKTTVAIGGRIDKIEFGGDLC